jgi:hypothetical protein
MRVTRLNGHCFAVRSLASPKHVRRSRQWHVRQARRFEDQDRPDRFHLEDDGDLETIGSAYNKGGVRNDHVP